LHGGPRPLRPKTRRVGKTHGSTPWQIGAHAGRSDTFLKLADGSEWSYAAFLANAARFAHALTGAGLAPGDRLAAQIHKSPEALALYAACVQAGIIFLPLNTAYTVDELSYFIENSGARMVVCDEARARRSPRSPTACLPQVETLNADGSGSLSMRPRGCRRSFRPSTATWDDLAAFLYTSGTTGRSKGAMLTQGNLLSNARTLAEYWRFTGGDVLLHALPIFHTHGLFVATNITLLPAGR
jgi:malonyl-CoA/methylmalonyl-CoA synthetase